MRSLRQQASLLLADDSGLTVLELVIAAAILLISAVSVIGALTFAGSASAQSSIRSRALSIANQQIEYARNLPYDEVGVSGGGAPVPGTIPPVQVLGSFTVETSVYWHTDPVTLHWQYKDIKVTVRWTRPQPGSVSVASAIYGKSNSVNTGGLEVRVRDAETGDPIPAADVTAYYQSTWVRDITKPWGNVIFGDIPAGVASVVVNAAGYVFEESELATVTIVPEVVTSVVARGYRASTATIYVVDSTGKKIASTKVLLTPGKGKPRTAGGDGEVTFTGLLPGDYQVDCVAPNRTVGHGVLSITRGGENVYLTVVLGDPVLPGSLTVKVRDPNGLSLEGATVRVFGPAPMTDETSESPKATVNGDAVFSQLGPGDYRVQASLAGFTSSAATGTISASGGTYTVTLVLLPLGGGFENGSLRIVVYDGAGSRLPGVAVRITYPNSLAVDRTTGPNGELLLGNLTPGTYMVRPNGGTTSYHTVLAGLETLAQVTGSP